MTIWETPRDEGGMLRQFIPALYTDNPTLLQDDPDYVARMEGLGNTELVRAMKEGDWSVVAGAFFDEWNPARHVLKPFTPPMSAERFRAADWGSARPFSVGWYAICNGDWPKVETTTGRQITIPKGAIVRYREWYGNKEGMANIGLKLTVEEWAKGVLSRSKGETFKYTVVDTSMFDEDGGPSMAERSGKCGLHLRRADKRRIPGWAQVRYRLKGDPEEEDREALLLVTANCKEFIRLFPVQQHDESDLEDLDSDGEDHVVDEVRYACMSRPKVIKYAKESKDSPSAGTFAALTEQGRKTRSKYRSIDLDE
jgi:hypothetical protein